MQIDSLLEYYYARSWKTKTGIMDVFPGRLFNIPFLNSPNPCHHLHEKQCTAIASTISPPLIIQSKTAKHFHTPRFPPSRVP